MEQQDKIFFDRKNKYFYILKDGKKMKIKDSGKSKNVIASKIKKSQKEKLKERQLRKALKKESKKKLSLKQLIQNQSLVKEYKTIQTLLDGIKEKNKSQQNTLKLKRGLTQSQRLANQAQQQDRMFQLQMLKLLQGQQDKIKNKSEKELKKLQNEEQVLQEKADFTKLDILKNEQEGIQNVLNFTTAAMSFTGPFAIIPGSIKLAYDQYARIQQNSVKDNIIKQNQLKNQTRMKEFELRQIQQLKDQDQQSQQRALQLQKEILDYQEQIKQLQFQIENTWVERLGIYLKNKLIELKEGFQQKVKQFTDLTKAQIAKLRKLVQKPEEELEQEIKQDIRQQLRQQFDKLEQEDEKVLLNQNDFQEQQKLQQQIEENKILQKENLEIISVSERIKQQLRIQEEYIQKQDIEIQRLQQIAQEQKQQIRQQNLEQFQQQEPLEIQRQILFEEQQEPNQEDLQQQEQQIQFEDFLPFPQQRQQKEEILQQRQIQEGEIQQEQQELLKEERQDQQQNQQEQDQQLKENLKEKLQESLQVSQQVQQQQQQQQDENLFQQQQKEYQEQQRKFNEDLENIQKEKQKQKQEQEDKKYRKMAENYFKNQKEGSFLTRRNYDDKYEDISNKIREQINILKQFKPDGKKISLFGDDLNETKEKISNKIREFRDKIVNEGVLDYEVPFRLLFEQAKKEYKTIYKGNLIDFIDYFYKTMEGNNILDEEKTKIIDENFQKLNIGSIFDDMKKTINYYWPKAQGNVLNESFEEFEGLTKKEFSQYFFQQIAPYIDEQFQFSIIEEDQNIPKLLDKSIVFNICIFFFSAREDNQGKHFTVFIHDNEIDQIYYYDPLGLISNENFEVSRKKIQEYIEQNDLQNLVKVKVNSVNTQKTELFKGTSKNDQNYCGIYVLIFIYRICVLNQSFKQATNFDSLSKREQKHQYQILEQFSVVQQDQGTGNYQFVFQ